MTETQTPDLWFSDHSGPLTVELSTESRTARVTDADGFTFTAVGLDAAQALFAAAGSRKLWAADAAMQERQHRAFLEDLGWPRIRCALTVDRALAPQKKKPLLLPGPHVAALMRTHGAAPALHRQLALNVEQEDYLWRKATRRGYLIDQVALPEERQVRHGELKRFARVHGVDIRRSDESKVPFLNSLGVNYERTGSYGWSWPGKCDTSSMPVENASIWTEYKAQHSVLKRAQFLDGIAKKIHADQRVHPLVRSNQAATGRMALQDPGLMSLMTELRGIVLSEHGHDILEVDHSSAEILVLARLIGSPAFSRRVLSGDPYQQLADATGLARNVVKPRLLAFVFDESLRGSAKSVGTEAAALIHEAIRQLFPEIVAWRAEQTERARRGERLTTLWGRPLPVLDGLSYETRPGLAANAQVQGSARDAFGHAVRAADSAGLTLFFPLHDALYVLAPHGTAAESSRLLVEAMTVDLGEGIVLSGKAKNHGGRWGK